jgi:hypothetical protein
MRMKYLFTALVILAGIGVGCDKTTNVYPNSDTTNVISTVGPSGQLQNQSVEFRVTGNATGARIKYATSVDGTVQVITALPFIQQMILPANVSSAFLSLEATPQSYSAVIFYPYMTVQIFVNGVVFREASSNDFFNTTLSVSGNYRK